MRKESDEDEDDDDDIVGGSCDEDYEDLNINISVDGFWESVIHFDYVVKDLSTNEIIETGKHAY